MLSLKPFYFIRHGETEWNKKNIIMGSIDVPLNEVGIEQAHQAAAVLSDQDFQIIVSSPRVRALKTAEIIATKNPKKIIVHAGFVERNWGNAEGKSYDPDKSLFSEDDTPIGAEPFLVFQKRAITSINQILCEYERPLIVSHGGVFKILTHYLGYPGFASGNGEPYLFNPPIQKQHSWQILHLAD